MLYVSYHNASEVDGGNGVENDEDALVVDVLDAVPSADRKRATEKVQNTKPFVRVVLHRRSRGNSPEI